MKLPVVGEPIPEVAKVVTREDVRAYAQASGDLNPLHLDDEVARAAGFPSVVAHGMFTMAHLANCVVRWAGGAEHVRRFKVHFRAPVFLRDEIVAGGTVRSVDPEARRVVLDLWVRVERDGGTEWPIRKGEAEVEWFADPGSSGEAARRAAMWSDTRSSRARCSPTGRVSVSAREAVTSQPPSQSLR